MCIPQQFLHPRLGNEFSLNILGTILYSSYQNVAEFTSYLTIYVKLLL